MPVLLSGAWRPSPWLNAERAMVFGVESVISLPDRVKPVLEALTVRRLIPAPWPFWRLIVPVDWRLPTVVWRLVVSMVSMPVPPEFLTWKPVVESVVFWARTEPLAVKDLPLATVVFWFKLMAVALLVPMARAPEMLSSNGAWRLVEAVATPVTSRALVGLVLLPMRVLPLKIF